MQAKHLRNIKPADDLLRVAQGLSESLGSVDPKTSDVTIYTLPTSICSQRVRLTLEERGVRYKDYSVNFRESENLQPWYIAMNPRALVPTLKVGDKVVFDSMTIMLFIDNYFTGPKLSPSDLAARDQMLRWLTRMDEFPVRDLSYRWQMERTRHGQPDYWTPAMHDNVRRAMDLYPEHRELYERKLFEWQDILACAADADHMAHAERMAQDFADDAEAAVQPDGYLVGKDFTLADVSATATLVRLQCGCGQRLWGDGLRPQLQEYVERLKARASYNPGLLNAYKLSTVFALEGDCWLPMRKAA